VRERPRSREAREESKREGRNKKERDIEIIWKGVGRSREGDRHRETQIHKHRVRKKRGEKRGK